MEDRVNHPKHYTSHPSGVECIQITEHYNFTVGNAMKYLWRQGLKLEANLDSKEKQIEDCNKAVWYINREIHNLKKEAKMENNIDSKSEIVYTRSYGTIWNGAIASGWDLFFRKAA